MCAYGMFVDPFFLMPHKTLNGFARGLGGMIYPSSCFHFFSCQLKDACRFLFLLTFLANMFIILLET